MVPPNVEPRASSPEQPKHNSEFLVPTAVLPFGPAVEKSTTSGPFIVPFRSGSDFDIERHTWDINSPLCPLQVFDRSH